MNYDWQKIREELINNIQKVFSTSTNPVCTNFEEVIDVFQKFVLIKSGILKLDGLPKTILPALYSAYISEKGTLNPLKILAEELEPFLKKIIFINTNADYSNNHLKSLGPLIKELGLNTFVSSSTQGFSTLFSQSNLVNYKGQDEFLEYLCHSYLIRNEVHNSPNWDFVDIFINLKSILTVYLYATLKYDFITFGASTTEIKQQLINSFILNYLKTNSKATINELFEKCNIHFNSTTDIAFYRRTIQKLIELQKIKSISKTEYELSEAENNRLIQIFEDFTFKEQMLLLEVKNKLQSYGIENKLNDIIIHLKQLFEDNYNIDIYEIYDKGIDINDNSVNCKQFTDYLKNELGISNADELFFDLLIICQENDFLHKISAGGIFAKFANTSQLENYIRLQKRPIFIDTQIVLYTLCLWYYDDVDYDNIFYKITRDLIKFKEQHSNIELFVSKNYLYEAAYQIKEALLLIPMEEIGFFENFGTSENVFYQFYNYLLNNDLLDENVDTFSDFMYGFDLEYDSVFDKNYIQITSDLIKEYLEQFSIETVEMPRLSIYDKEPAFEIFKNSLNVSGKPRPEVTILNDALMLKFLSIKNETYYDPIFITWDTIFYDARSKYLHKFKGASMWHLFSPAKLLNHLSLLEFKINAESITNEFLSIMDANDLHHKTVKYLDSLNSILDIDKDSRRKYLMKLKDLNKKYVFELDKTSDEDTNLHTSSQPLEAIIRDLTFYYHDWNNKYNFDDFKSIFKIPEYFDKITNIFNDELEYYLKNCSFSYNLHVNVNTLISEIKAVENK